MIKILIFFFFLIAVLSKISNAVSWGNNDWAFACEFKGNELKSERTSGYDCGPRCASTSGCTHWTWSNRDGGICYMKKGTVHKSNAVDTGDMSMTCGVVANPVSDDSSRSSTVKLSTINKCSFKIWVGFYAKSKSNPNYKMPFGGGWLLNPSQVVTFDVPSDLFAARVWGRTNCNTINGVFRCETGDCGPNVQCAYDGVPKWGELPATLAEFAFKRWNNQDFYDISLVDGFNVKMTMTPKTPNGNPNGYWCTNPSCQVDMNEICPNELKKFNSAGRVVGCSSACTKFKTDQYCCVNQYNEKTCIPSQWPVNYAAWFKKVCPTSYSYAYDDPTSTFSCRNTGYDIIFC